MKFGEIPIGEAIGAILAHSVGPFKKGRSLSADDVKALQEEGVSDVYAAQLEQGDIGEDEAARLSARAVTGEGISVAEAFTGRVNLYAEHAGVLVLGEHRLRTINQFSENLTIATLPAFEKVAAGQMVATVKVITFAVPEDVVAAVQQICESPPLTIMPFSAKKAGLVQTRLPNSKNSLFEKTRKVISDRLEECGSVLAQDKVCEHSSAAVAAAVTSMHRDGMSPIMVFGASAIVDRGDVVPRGIEMAGGEIVHLGMPVDPGNLLLLGQLEETPVIGVPSCARSPKLNGFDWVLQRLLADIDVSASDIMDMGIGGLLKEIPSRPRPRERAARAGTERHAPRIASIVLAAGLSSRMGEANKLLHEINGTPLVRKTAETALSSKASSVFVVTGHEEDKVAIALEGLDVKLVHNDDFKSGLASSLKTGIDAVGAGFDAVIVMLGDMPLVGPEIVNKLIAAFDPDENRSICVPVYEGKRGNPVLWGAQYFEEFSALTGDIGAKYFLSQYSEAVCEVAIDSDNILADFDTPESLKRLAEG